MTATDVRPTMHSWKLSLDSFDEQIKYLDTHMTLDPNEIKKIYDINALVLTKIRKIWDKAQSQLDELNKKGYDPISRPFWKMAIGKGLSYITVGIGSACAINTSEAVMWTGAGLQITGGIFATAALVYDTYIDQRTAKREEIARLIKKSTVVEVFQQFLSELKILIEMTKQTEQEHVFPKEPSCGSFNLEDSRRIDNSIGRCLQHYDRLPSNYKKQETYCRLISQLILRLPQDDPLQINFRELMPLYPDRKAVSWNAEEAAYPRENSMDGVQSPLALSEDALRERFNKCHELAQQRFNCPRITFFECNGLRINEEGVATSIIPIEELTSKEIEKSLNHRLPQGNEPFVS